MARAAIRVPGRVSLLGWRTKYGEIAYGAIRAGGVLRLTATAFRDFAVVGKNVA